MALPLIPIAYGVGAAKVIYDFWQSDKYEKRALAANYDAYTMVETANRKLKEKYTVLEATLLKLGNRKRGIMSGILPKFVDVYEKIIKIDFTESELQDNQKSLTLWSNNICDIKKMISVSGVQMSDKEIIGTFLFSLSYGGISGAIKKDAEINLDIAYTRSDEAEVIAHNTDTARIAVEGITEKAESLLKLLAQMNVFFLKSIQHSDEIIERNGFHRTNYSSDDKKALMTCINFAKAIKDILEAPLFDADGKVSRQINKTLSLGNEYVRKMQAIK